MQTAFENFLQYSAGIRHLSQHTVTSYRQDLEIFSAWIAENELDFTQVTVADMRIFTAELRNRNFAPASVNRCLSCIRSFYRYAIKQKLCKTNPAAAIRNIKQPEKLPVFLFPEEAAELCSFPETAGILWHSRDEALFSSLYSTGCRISELLSLTAENIKRDCTSAVILGKGKKERKIFFADFAQNALRSYLPERNVLLEKQHKTAEQALFVNRKGSRLTSGGVRYIIDRYTTLLPHFKQLSPHGFRHSFASMFVTRGADIRVVQELLGHSSISTTQRYTHITAAQLQNLYHTAHPHG